MCAEMLADLSLFCTEIRGSFSREMIAKACLVLACTSTSHQSPLIYADKELLSQCVKQLRALWMEFTAPGSPNSRFKAISLKYSRNELPTCPAFSTLIDFSNVRNEQDK